MVDPAVPDLPLRRDRMREVVFREMAKKANADPAFRAVVEPLGFFTVMDLMDGMVDALIAAEDGAQDA